MSLLKNFFEKKLTITLIFDIIYTEIERRISKMARIKSQGWYIFADGTKEWFHGLSAQEKKVEIRKHGAIIKFIAT